MATGVILLKSKLGQATHLPKLSSGSHFKIKAKAITLSYLSQSYEWMAHRLCIIFMLTYSLKEKRIVCTAPFFQLIMNTLDCLR